MRTVLAVCALLLTAGCVGVLPVDGGDGPEPAGGFPPGVSAQGVENATKLANAHEAALAETGYAHEYELTEIGVESAFRPEWASKARNAIDAFVEVDESQDDEHAVVENEEGEPLPAGSTVELTYAGKTHTSP